MENKIVRFGELYQIPSSNGLSRPSAVRGIGFKMINMGELFANNIISDIPMERVQMSETEQKKFFVEQGDLLFARQSLVAEGAGKCSIVKFFNEPTTFESHLIRVRLNQKVANPWYYYYLFQLKSNPIKAIINQCAQAGIRGSELVRIKVPNPPLPTQQKIASILSAYDNLIQNYKKQIEALQTAASELYKEWFVRFRFPGWQTTKFENGIPKGWKVEKLTKLVEVKYGKDHSKLDVGNIPVYGSGGIMRYCNKALYDKETVLIPRKGSLNNIMYANNPLWTVDTMFYTVMLRKNIAKYLYYVLSKIDMESFNAGAALPSMTTEILSHFKIIVPDNEILESFDKKIALIFTQIDNLQQQITNLTQQRDLLLPRLMSGKLEVE